MASYLSTPDTPQEYQSPINLNLLNQALSVNQGKYDNGLQKYNNNLVQLKVQENLLLRQEDKDRFAQNVQGLIDEVNKSGKINWAKSGLTNKINAYTNMAIDDYTLDQIGISQSIRNFDTEIKKKREKNDGSYSDVNYAFAQEQAGIANYLQGRDAQGNKVDKIGALQYTNYIDVNKSALEKAKAFKELKGEETVEIPFTDSDGVRRTKTTSVKGLTESEILAYMPQILSPQEGKQLQINGWAKYQGENGLAVAQEAFKSYTKNVEENLNANIEKYNVDYNNKNLTQEQRNQAFRNKTAEEDRKSQYLQSFKSIDPNNSASIGGFLETTNWKTTFAKMAGAKTSVTYDTDAAFYDAKDLELKYSAESRAVQKHALEMTKLQQEISKEAVGAVGSGTGISLSNLPVENVDETNPYTTLVKDFATESVGIVSLANNTLQGGGIDDNTKKSYQANYAEAIKSGYAPATAAKTAFSKSGLSNLFPEQYSQILEAYVRRNDMASVLKESNTQTVNVFKQDPAKYVSSLRQKLNSLGRVETTGAYGIPIMSKTADSPEVRQAQDFVNKNGGWDNLQKTLLADPTKIPVFENVLNGLETLADRAGVRTTLNPFGSVSLREDSLSGRNKIVADKGKGIVTTNKLATVTNDKVKEQIINAIPQMEGEVAFDPKKGLSFRRTDDGSFEVIQSGLKEGVKGIFGSARTYTVKRGDDLYNVLNAQALNEAQSRQVTAGNYTTPINNENIQFLDMQQKSALNKASNFISGTLGVNFQMGSKVNPSYFLTQPTTDQVYKQKLQAVIPVEKIEALTALMSKDAYNKFTVSATPVQGQWTTSVSLKKGGAPLLLSETETGKQVMDKQLLLFIKQYPQILVGEAVLEYLQQNPKEIDTVLNRLK